VVFKNEAGSAKVESAFLFFTQRREGAKAQVSHRDHEEIEAQGVFLCAASCRSGFVVQHFTQRRKFHTERTGKI
jgi:hypothetical protein